MKNLGIEKGCWTNSHVVEELDEKCSNGSVANCEVTWNTQKLSKISSNKFNKSSTRNHIKSYSNVIVTCCTYSSSGSSVGDQVKTDELTNFINLLHMYESSIALK